MTYNQNKAKAEKSEANYIAVEMDVRRAMKEACATYKDETASAIYRWRHAKQRARLARQLGNALMLSVAFLTLAACGMRVEWYGYSPDEFERNDRQAKVQHYERAQK